MIKAVLFDLGGTIYKNEILDRQYPAGLIRMLARDRGITEEESSHLMKITAGSVEAASGRHPTKVATLEALGYTRSQVHEEFCKVEPAQYLESSPEVASILGELASTYTLVLVSNFRKTHVAEILAALEVDSGVFSAMVGEEDVTNIKPDPEPFLKGVAATGFSAAMCVFVGDSCGKDMRPAKQAGMKTVWVSDKEGDCEFADAKISDIIELPETLEKL